MITKSRAAIVALSIAALTIPLAMGQHAMRMAEKPVELMTGLGPHHHPIATRNPEAQKFFDQGLNLLYGFNHAEAARSFRRAAELDPGAVMPLWGVGLALAPNYNRDIDPVSSERNKEGHEAVQKALALAAAPPHERAYAQALAKRYTLDPKADTKRLEVEYKDAMGEHMRRYPDDLDAATLYAESLMNLRPWKLWNADGTPAEGTEETIRVLERVLERDPDHAGAHHLYIHAVEASPHPHRGLTSAARLPELAPAAGHLVHMPAHIYLHTGDYERAAVLNERASQVDEEFFRRTGTAGVYGTMYYTHNIHFVAVARAAQGKFAEARQAAARLAAEVEPHVKDMPPMESFLLVPVQVLLRFHRWDDVLNLPAPDEKRLLSRAFRHYARACALAVRGRAAEAVQEQKAFDAVRNQIPADTPFATNPVVGVMAVATATLDARLAPDAAASIVHWEKAVQLQDALSYGEPPDWFYPVRESWGAALLRAGRAPDAERVFRDDLKRNRRNGRSLFGLWECLKAQNKSADAELVRLEFERAWQQAAPLRIEDY